MGIREATHIVDRCDKPDGGSGANAWHGHQPATRLILLRCSLELVGRFFNA
jgi:hypothetical protein